MTDNEQLRVRVLLQATRQSLEILSRFHANDIRIEVVENARGERDLNPFTHTFHDCARDLELQLLRLLIHLMSNDGAGSSTDHGADDGTARGRPGVVPDDAPDGRASHRPDDRPLLFATGGCTRRGYERE